ncbi:tetratricopeptide repeat protein [Bacteroidota bacterium]
MKINYFFSFLFLLLFISSAFASKKDSLINIIKTSATSDKKIDAFISLNKMKFGKKLDSLKVMTDSALRWAQRELYHKGVAESYTNLGNIFLNQGIADSAIIYFKKSIKYSEENALNKNWVAALARLSDLYSIYGYQDSAMKYIDIGLVLAEENGFEILFSDLKYSLGNVFNDQGEYNKALECFFECRAINENLKDTVRLIYIYNAFGSAYKNLGDFEKSLKFFRLSMKLDEKTDKVNILVNSYNNLGVLYWQIAKNYDSARYYISKTLEIMPKPIIPRTEKITYINLGGIETDDGKNYKAIEYYKKALAVKLPIPSAYIQSALYINIGISFNGLNIYDSARYYTFKGLKLAKSNKLKEWIKNSYSTLYRIDSAENKFDSALYYMTKYYAMKDSLSREELEGKIANLEIKYESEKKEAENIELKKENDLNNRIIRNNRIIIIIAALALIIFILYLINISRSRKAQKQKNIELSEINNKILIQQDQLEKANTVLEEQKKQLSELIITKDKFFSIIAHDLRSPFNVILGSLDMLENEYDNISENEKRLLIQNLHSSSKNTYRLLLNLLDWSRAQRGLIKNNPEKIDISEIAINTVNVLEEAITGKDQIIRNKIPAGSFVNVDPELIQTVFLNLINNAIKFSQRKGEILISGQDVGTQFEISVKDFGIGIPADRIPKLFDIDCGYNQLGTDKEAGTGLGLIIVREFIDLMGSSIMVESEIGKWSEFRFKLDKA